jgi:hypothetical protein
MNDYLNQIKACKWLHQFGPIRQAVKADAGLTDSERGTLLGAIIEREDTISQTYMVNTLLRDADRRRGIY